MRLYATYTGLVYVTPVFGGLLADRYLGFRRAVVLGAVLMTCGHASLALERAFFFYLGLGLLVVGNGFFKPNISSIVGHLYPKNRCSPPHPHPLHAKPNPILCDPQHTSHPPGGGADHLLHSQQ